MEYQGIPSLQGLDRAIAVIVVSEIGDKTFLVAAILSMRHANSRATVFAGSITALGIMSLLSALMGRIMPSLLPKRYTTAAAALLFFVFGVRMMQEGLEMEGGEVGREKMEQEMLEVQKEVEEAEEGGRGGSGAGGARLVDMEEGRLESPVMDQIDPNGAEGAPPQRSSHHKARKSLSVPSKEDAVASFKDGAKNLCQLFFSPIFVQAFVLTFLAEWGDRSQITTIALAAAHNVWLVTLGTTMGHSFCTMLAVLGGHWISRRVSIKLVTLVGAALFLVFGIVYSFEAWKFDEAAEAILTSVGAAAVANDGPAE